MAKTKRVRWECPAGKHAGVLGSTRPRANATVRYCLDCSREAGVLVERIVPALERKREASAARSQAKAAAKAKREREKEREHYTVGGHDLREAMKRAVKLPAFGGPKGRMAKSPPKLDVRNTSGGVGGRAWPWENRVLVNRHMGPASVETLLHELAHIRVGRTRNGKVHGWHGPEWKKCYSQARYEWVAKYGDSQVREPGLGVNSYC